MANPFHPHVKKLIAARKSGRKKKGTLHAHVKKHFGLAVPAKKHAKKKR